MKFPWHLFPKNPQRLLVEFAVDDLTFFHTDENGQLHEIPRHIAEILGMPDILELIPDDSEFVHYLDSKGHIQKLPRKDLDFPEPPWGWNGAQSALLSDSGPNDAVMISRASKVEGGPATEGTERPQS